jgi:hypothetical protein
MRRTSPLFFLLLFFFSSSSSFFIGNEGVDDRRAVEETLNNKYRRCEVHVAVGVEYYIHVPQATWDVDVVFNADGHIYLAPFILIAI